mgnify:CR=1 FL=1
MEHENGSSSFKLTKTCVFWIGGLYDKTETREIEREKIKSFHEFLHAYAYTFESKNSCCDVVYVIEH